VTPEIERFIESATRPLDDRPDELDLARTELMSRLSHQGVPLEMIDLSAPTARLEAAPRRNPWLRRGLQLVALVLLLAGVGVAVGRQVLDLMGAAQASRLRYVARWGTPSRVSLYRFDELQGYLDRQAPGLGFQIGPPSELFGQALHGDPQNLGFLQQQLRYLPAHAPEFLTDEQRRLIEREDPGNALWDLMEAEWHLDAAYGRPRGERYHGGGTVMKGHGRYEQAWLCFHRAAQQGTFLDHSGRAKRSLADAFPPETGMIDGMIREALVEQVALSVGPLFRSAQYSSANNEIETRLRSVGGGAWGEAEAELFEDWQKLVRLILASRTLSQFAGDDLNRALASQAQNFRLSLAPRSGDDEEGKALEARAEEWHDALRHLVSAASPAAATTDPRKLAAIRVAQNREMLPHLDPEELTGSRKVERAMFDRIMAVAGALLWLLVSGMCAFELARRRRATRGLAAGLMPLLERRDWAWVIGAGALAPWGFAALLSFGTPLGMRDLSLYDEPQVMSWMIRWAAAWTLSLSLLLQVAQWRWAKRAGFLGLGQRTLWAGWALCGVAVAGLLAAGIMRYLGWPKSDRLAFYLLGAAGCVAVPLLWNGWFGVVNLFTPAAGSLRANLVTRTVLPVSLGLGLAMLGAAGLFRWQEARWMHRDPLLPSWTSDSHFHALEQREGERSAARLREQLDGL